MSNDRWPKLKRDYAGLTVRLKRDIENGGGTIFKAGVLMKVTGYYRGLELETVEICPHCNIGARRIIRRVGQYDVELCERERPHERSAG